MNLKYIYLILCVCLWSDKDNNTEITKVIDNSDKSIKTTNSANSKKSKAKRKKSKSTAPVMKKNNEVQQNVGVNGQRIQSTDSKNVDVVSKAQKDVDSKAINPSKTNDKKTVETDGKPAKKNLKKYGYITAGIVGTLGLLGIAYKIGFSKTETKPEDPVMPDDMYLQSMYKSGNMKVSDQQMRELEGNIIRFYSSYDNFHNYTRPKFVPKSVNAILNDQNGQAFWLNLAIYATLKALTINDDKWSGYIKERIQHYESNLRNPSMGTKVNLDKVTGDDLKQILTYKNVEELMSGSPDIIYDDKTHVGESDIKGKSHVEMDLPWEATSDYDEGL